MLAYRIKGGQGLRDRVGVDKFNAAEARSMMAGAMVDWCRYRIGIFTPNPGSSAHRCAISYAARPVRVTEDRRGGMHNVDVGI